MQLFSKKIKKKCQPLDTIISKGAVIKHPFIRKKIINIPRVPRATRRLRKQYLCSMCFWLRLACEQITGISLPDLCEFMIREKVSSFLTKRVLRISLQIYLK